MAIVEKELTLILRLSETEAFYLRAMLENPYLYPKEEDEPEPEAAIRRNIFEALSGVLPK